MTLLEELKNRKKISSNTNLKNVEATLSKMYSWVITKEQIEGYLDELFTVLDDIESPHNSFSDFPGIGSLKEQAAVGLDLLSCCHSNINGNFLLPHRGIWDCLDNFGLTDYQNIRRDHVMANIRDNYLTPFWDYLILKVEQENDNHTIESKINYKIFNVLDDDFKKIYPNTLNLIEIANEALNHQENTWNGVANACRDILIEFGKELMQNHSNKNFQIKKGNTKAIIRTIIREELPSDRYYNTLINLFESNWNHVSSALHRSSLNKRDVTRIYVWVILTITEIAELNPQSNFNK